MRTEPMNWQHMEARIVESKEPLFRFIYRIVLHQETAEELFQETWVKAMTKIHTYDPDKAFEPWIYRIARNLCFDYFRKQTRFRNRQHLLVEEPHQDKIEYLPQEEARMMACLGRIPVEFRDVLHLRFYEGLTVKEIAHIVRRPQGTVKSRISRGLKRLKQVWEKKDD